MIRHFRSKEAKDRFVEQLLGVQDARRLKAHVPKAYDEALDFAFLPESPECVSLTLKDNSLLIFNLLTEQVSHWEDLGPENNYARSFSKFLSYKIFRSGLSQDEICRRSSISPATLSRILIHGRIPDLFETIKLADAIGFDPSEVFFY